MYSLSNRCLSDQGNKTTVLNRDVNHDDDNENDEDDESGDDDDDIDKSRAVHVINE